MYGVPDKPVELHYKPVELHYKTKNGRQHESDVSLNVAFMGYKDLHRIGPVTHPLDELWQSILSHSGVRKHEIWLGRSLEMMQRTVACNLYKHFTVSL